MFARHEENLTWFSTFIHVSTDRNLTSSCFVRPVTKYICTEVEKVAHFADNIENDQKPLPPSPPTFASVSDSLIDVEVLGNAASETKKTDTLGGDEQISRRKHKISLLSSCGWLNRFPYPKASDVDSMVAKT